MRRTATMCGALAAVVTSATASEAQTAGGSTPPVVYRAGVAAGAPQVQLWVVDGPAPGASGRMATPHGAYDPYDAALAGGRVYFRVSADAYVTVAAIGSGGRVRILFPRSPQDLRQTAGRSTRSVSLDDANRASADWSSWGYVAAIAAYAAPDYGGFAPQGRWRERNVARPEWDDPTAAVEELARQLYPDGSDYAVDFAFYRAPYGGTAQSAYRSTYRDCARFGYDWTFAPWELLSPYDVGCWNAGWGYYGWTPFVPRHKPRGYYPGRGDGRGDRSRWDADERMATRDAGHERRPRHPRGQADGAPQDGPPGGDGGHVRPPNSGDDGRPNGSAFDDRVRRTDDPPRAVRGSIDPHSPPEVTRDRWRVTDPTPGEQLWSIPPVQSPPPRAEPPRAEPPRREIPRAAPPADRTRSVEPARERPREQPREQPRAEKQPGGSVIVAPPAEGRRASKPRPGA